MTCTDRRFAVVVRLALLLAAFGSTTIAQAQEKPFKITGEGVGPEGLPLPGDPARPHSIVGNATHLGRHEGLGYVQTDSAAPIIDPELGLVGFTGTFGSGIDEHGNRMPFTFVAANGDKLVCMYGRTAFGASEPGTFTLTIVGVDGPFLVVEALFVAEFIPQPDLSTGRFAGVTGGWTMFAQSESFRLGTDDPVFYSWEGEGTLVFPKKKKAK